jgi:hypothetical protein
MFTRSKAAQSGAYNAPSLGLLGRAAFLPPPTALPIWPSEKDRLPNATKLQPVPPGSCERDRVNR